MPAETTYVKEPTTVLTLIKKEESVIQPRNTQIKNQLIPKKNTTVSIVLPIKQTAPQSEIKSQQHKSPEKQIIMNKENLEKTLNKMNTK